MILSVIGLVLTSYLCLRESRRRAVAEAEAQQARQEVERLRREIQQLQGAHIAQTRRAETDALTGLPNRAAFLDRFASWPQRQVAALILMDLDHFKRLNDTQGHQAGDEALKGLARLLRACLRPSDLPFRYGGEEFGALLAPGTGLDAAARVAERIRAEAERTLPCTLSAGVAMGAAEAEPLIQAADAALYEAKRGGRNLVVVAGSGLPSDCSGPRTNN